MLNVDELKKAAELDKKLRQYLFDRYSAPSFGAHGSQSWYGINREDIEAILELLAKLSAAEEQLAESNRKGSELASCLGNLGIHIHDLGLRNAGKMGEWKYRNQRAEVAEERVGVLEKSLKSAIERIKGREFTGDLEKLLCDSQS